MIVIVWTIVLGRKSQAVYYHPGPLPLCRCYQSYWKSVKQRECMVKI